MSPSLSHYPDWNTVERDVKNAIHPAVQCILRISTRALELFGTFKIWLQQPFLARLDKVQEELLYYPRRRLGVFVGIGGGGISKKFNVKVFYVMGKALSGELSCPCDRSC